MNKEKLITILKSKQTPAPFDEWVKIDISLAYLSPTLKRKLKNLGWVDCYPMKNISAGFNKFMGWQWVVNKTIIQEIGNDNNII